MIEYKLESKIVIYHFEMQQLVLQPFSSNEKKKVRARAQSNERQRTEILFKKKCINLRSDKN